MSLAASLVVSTAACATPSNGPIAIEPPAGTDVIATIPRLTETASPWPTQASSTTPTIRLSPSTSPTSQPAATPAPTITPGPTLTPGPVCRPPVGDYTRVTVNGQTVNRRTALMLETAAELYPGPGDVRRVVQGSYTDELAASFGTHAGGGVVDISIRNPIRPEERLFGEVEGMVLALRQAGFAAWYRAADEVYPGSAPHIHAVAVGDRELSPAAELQLTGPAGYFRGMNGFPDERAGPDRHGGPVVCPWMVEAGYRDLR
jgi:hypothetical protein